MYPTIQLAPVQNQQRAQHPLGHTFRTTFLSWWNWQTTHSEVPFSSMSICLGSKKTYLLANEADVVRASGQHLVYPINMLLPELFPGIATELKIICNSEVSENQESRFDMRWLLCRPGSGKPDVTVVILEYKTTRVLHRRDFELGKCNEENAGEMMREASKRRNKTNFEKCSPRVTASEQVLHDL